ncbi:MAG: AAA domain-containing protein [Treponema sp.]|nr:AAA domain-containing protein [Treponema sp.]
MGHLLLNFAGNSESGSSRLQDFYNTPLKKQYEALVSRYSQLKRFSYEQFIQACFPVTSDKDYYISMPNFLREGLSGSETIYFNNIVIRSPRDGYSEHVLPKGLELIIIGDIRITPHGIFTVKGIEFIDGFIYKKGEKKIHATAACAFGTTSFPVNGATITVPDYGRNIKEFMSVITRNLMEEICRCCYTVSKPVDVLRTYENWKEYIGFRNYYLEEQGKDTMPIDSCEAIKCYVISKSDYQKNREKYDEHILDDHDRIRSDTQIVVTKQFENSEAFPLVRVIIDKNKRELFADKKNKGDRPVFVQKLNRFTRSNVSLENIANGRWISIDERYGGLYEKDIEPDYSQEESRFTQKLKFAYLEIDGRFAAILKQRLTEYVRNRAESLESDYAKRLSDYKNELARSLERDVSENKDAGVRAEYAAQVKKKEDIVRAESQKMEEQYTKKIESAQKGKEKSVKETVVILEKQRGEERIAFAEKLAQQKKTVSLRKLYIELNERRVARKVTSLKTEQKDMLLRNEAEKKREILDEQENQVRNEKEKTKRELDAALVEKKRDMKENDTIRRYFVYFKLQGDDTPDRINDEIAKIAPSHFKNDVTAEKSKIKRLEKSLNSFFGGYVKNPFLSTYLFATDELGDNKAELPELEYFSPRLNPKQKEAVGKAIASESVFLLQGPPGTGKTEVIAEIAAQYAKRGKRILISSETHKAIDNVFERLPKIPEIRPLRLIPSQSKKEQNQYSPEKLVDNFYINISDRLNAEVERFENFNDEKMKFKDEYGLLRLEHSRLKKEKSRIEKIQINLNRIARKRDVLMQMHDAGNEKLRLILKEKDNVFQRIKNIESLNLSDNEDEKYIKASFYKLLQKYPVLKQDIKTLVHIRQMDIYTAKEEIDSLSGNSRLVELEAKRNKIREQMAAIRDPDTEDPIIGKENEYKELKNALIVTTKKIKDEKSTSNVDLSELSIAKIVNTAELKEDTIALLVGVLADIKSELIRWIEKSKEHVSEYFDKKTAEYNRQKQVLGELKSEIRNKDNEAQAARDEGGYDNYKTMESGLKRKITEFFDKFEILEPYDDINAALDIIDTEWNELERNYAARDAENKNKIPMYERILKFLRELQGDGTIEDDRMKYTKKLFENANVLGLTCSSRDNFRADSIEAFGRYNIDGLDVKKQGIDVVIIDEVSKSSFLDLLVPILYGKTVILVGDHRQLPPHYDLRNLRRDDFDGLNPEIINREKNDHFINLYEECFFKTLFENVPDRLRVTLTKQYRCHEDIMRVFNHFYSNERGQGGLELGIPNQNDQKQHGLNIKNRNSKSIIENDKHIYFVDCGDSYERFGDGTSATNETEAKVIIRLAKEIDEAYARTGKFTVDKSRGKDTRMSMGVICTYGEQAKLVKRHLKKNTLKNVCEKHDERFIVSTVDDFQGDERDIIFVSMVRNPEPKNRARTRAEFVKKFERINVALSRARRLLVIVGAKDFLSEATIDLPDMNGNKALDRRAYPIYKEIINTIFMRGLLLKAADILEEGKPWKK